MEPAHLRAQVLKQGAALSSGRPKLFLVVPLSKTVNDFVAPCLRRPGDDKCLVMNRIAKVNRIFIDFEPFFCLNRDSRLARVLCFVKGKLNETAP
jgi:hypothetical protein